MISDERLAKIEELVCANLNEETIVAKVSFSASEAFLTLFQGGISAVNARVYAVRVGSNSSFISCRFKLPLQANRNKLLDVARETYKENVGDIYQLNKTLADQYELPLTLMYQDSGFVFVLKKTASDRELPRGFINVSSRKGKWLFSSIELVRILLESPAGRLN